MCARSVMRSYSRDGVSSGASKGLSLFGNDLLEGSGEVEAIAAEC